MRIVTFTIYALLILPAFAFAQSGAKAVAICKGTTLRLRAESTSATSFEWLRNNETIAGASGKELVAAEEGRYTVFGINADGCLSETSLSIDLTYHVPVTVDDRVSAKSNEDLLLDVLLNDQSMCAALDTATMTVKKLPAHGVIFRRNGKFLFKPQKGYEGLDTFTYTVHDESGLAANVATVTIELSSAPLPVTLISFDAVKEGIMAFITWITSIELYSDHFEIERSSDARNWRQLGEVQASGTSNAKNTYSFMDSLPESGLNYYRLKMIDLDGSFAYSRIKSVHFPEFSWAKMFPNPVNDVLQIIISNKKVRKIRLIDSYGRVMHAGEVSSASMQLDMKTYVPGTYFIHLEQDDGLVRVFKIVHLN